MFKYKNQFFYFIFVVTAILILSFVHILIGPILIAFLISYLLDPVLEYFDAKNFHRTYSSFLIITCLVISIGILSWIFFPIIYDQIVSIVKHLPTFKLYMEDVLLPKLQKITFDITGQRHKQFMHLYDILPADFGKYSDAIISQLGASTKAILSWLILIILTPILTFFFLRDFRKLGRVVLSLVPIHVRPGFLDLTRELNRTLKSVIMGQITVISILCVLYSSFLVVAGLPSAIAVGVLTGVARFVPYMDTLVGSFLCFFVLVTNSADNKLIITVFCAFLSVQAIDGLFITPRIMGKFSGVPPFLVLLSVICFGSWFGFYGVLLAVPAAAIGRVIIKMIVLNYKKSSFFIA